jgi:DNA-binding NarL/FixJ family response regulator
MDKEIIAKVLLTDMERFVLNKYVQEGLTQKQIAVEVYGDSKRQGTISKVLRRLNKKLKTPVTKYYNKRWASTEFEIKIKIIRQKGVVAYVKR